MKLTRPANKDTSNPWAPPGAPVTLATHRGADFGWGNGDQILAALEGEVISIYGSGGDNGGWGNRVILDHGHSIYTAYNHIATGTFGVSKGQRVGTSQQLARMGETGRADGKHLHFELMLGGSGPANRVDPAPYFSIDLPGTGTPVDPAPGRAARKVKNPVGDGYVNGRLKPTLAGEVRQKLAAGAVGTFDGFIRGQAVTVQGTTSNIWYRGAFNGNYFAAAGFETQETAGLPDLGTFDGAPAAPAVPLAQYVRIGAAWYYYTSLARALKASKAYATGLLAPNDYRVLKVSAEGPIQVATQSVGNVWLGTRNTRPPVVWK